MNRIYNFSSGPAMLPEAVLTKAQNEMLVYKDSGQSVMEMSHRSAEFLTIIESCEKHLRELLQIGNDYHVLFIQGGASLQFSMIPMNLAKTKVQIIHTGEWTKKAYIEHKKVVPTEIIASSEDELFSYIPEITADQIDKNADYLYICQNNTIFGSRYDKLPETQGLPLVADLSSIILSEPIIVNDYGLIFAGAQKNIGPAGVCIVIVRKDLIGNNDENLPTMLNYHTYIDNASLFNTPPTYTIYLCDLVCQWLLEDIGGLENMQKINQEKAKILYDYLDESSFFHGAIRKQYRSLMNVTFVSPTKELDQLFIKEAATVGLVNLAGHRLVNGMRASIYNAMPLAGVKALVEFMKEFEVQHG